MKKIFTLTIFIAIACAAKAQTFNYAWHNSHNDETSYRSNESRVVGDTIYVLSQFNGDTLDANPYAAQDWIYDSTLSSWSTVFFVTKYLTSGQYVSSKKLLEIASGGVTLNDFQIDNNGQLILIGDAYSTGIDFNPTTAVVGSYLYPSTADQFSFIAFYSSGGGYVGHIEYPRENNQSLYLGNGVVDSANKLYVVGQVDGTVDFDFTSGVDSVSGDAAGDAAVLCIDLNAQTYLWGKSFGSAGNDFAAYATVNNGLLYLYGTFEGATIDMDPSAGVYNKSKPAGTSDWTFIATWTLSGALNSCSVFGGLNDEVDPGGIIADDQGNIYVTGNCYYQDSVDVDPGAGVHLLDIPKYYACFLVKYSSSFNFLWATTMGNDDYISQSWSYDRTGILEGTSFIVMGADVGTGTIYISQNSVTDSLQGDGIYGFIMAAIDKSTGATDTTYVLRGDTAAHPNAYLSLTTMTTDIDDNVYLAGDFNALVDFNVENSTVNYDTSYLYNSIYYYERPFLMKLNANGFTSVNEPIMTDGVAIYPNPTNGIVRIESEQPCASVSVYNLNGQLISQSACQSSRTTTIDLSMNSAGVYFVQVVTEDGRVSTVRVVKQ